MHGTNPGGAGAADGRVRGAQQLPARRDNAAAAAHAVRLRATDLYSGIGGWALGFRMAGIPTVAAYEWWAPANRTYAANLGETPDEVDIRGLDPASLPPDIDILVGSPPCTEFSFANRGGSGDIGEGLLDVAKFLELVAHVRPRYWAMENVPRVAAILGRELGLGGSLSRYSELVKVVTVVDAAEFGLPQSRKRMLAGDFPLSTLHSYPSVLERRTLGEVLVALAGDPVVDPVYRLEMRSSEVTGLEQEPLLTDEEIRMNRDAKQFHPVYNKMRFPEHLDRPARTVTATCTRVSRESIVIREADGGYRRLNLRERASLQGFPIWFRYWADSYSDALQMVGNALPPLLAYYVAHAMLETRAADLQAPTAEIPPVPTALPATLKLEVRSRYPRGRRFRAAIPNLRFGSGVRFELVNEATGPTTTWRVAFYYGTSKRVLSAEIGAALLERLEADDRFSRDVELLRRVVRVLERTLDGVSGSDVQAVWGHRSEGLHPHEITDKLGDLAATLHTQLPSARASDRARFVLRHLDARRAGDGAGKLENLASWVYVGLLIGSWFNSQARPARRGDEMPLAV